MPPPPGFKSETQRENFLEAARLHRRGGPLATQCGAKLRTGRVCTQLPLVGGLRCLRHAGPDAARAHRERQLFGLQTGRVSPAEFARAEARRARNGLVEGWKRNPSLPGRTIDLGLHEAAFVAGAAALGLDVGTLLPALSDWLRWRFRRYQLDRRDDAKWARVVQSDLRVRQGAADRAMVWVRAGNLDRRTKAGRALKAALQSGGLERAVALGLAPETALERRHEALAEPAGVALSGTPVRPWMARQASAATKRAMPDRYRVPALKIEKRAGTGRPRKNPRSEDEARDLMDFARTCGPEVRNMLDRCPDDPARLDLLRTLRAFHQNPNDPAARNRWVGLVMRLGRG